ncbi:ABC-F family ATP-binding cassette domain-containing protein [Bdellovibrionota bacterium FG-1]
MAILVSAHSLRKAFAARPLFDGLTFAIESGERIGLIGPNGAGKSTLLKILAGKIQPDEGKLSIQRGLRVGFLEQVPTFNPGISVFETVLEGTPDPHDWECMALAHEQLSKLSLDGSEGVGPDSRVDTLSGGWKKRVALARELVRQPDLLLLDEPTNHLDVESILWLEDFLAHAPFAALTITHDRLFLQRIANRIIELDPRNPGGLLSIQGDYAHYLETKDLLMAAQERREIILKNTLRRETEWLRQGAKARTTKQQARIQRAGDLKDEVGELGVRNQQRVARIDFQGSDKNPKRLVEAKKISKSYGKRVIFKDVDLLLSPGSRIGLLGPNGCGKSTLIRVLLGQEESDNGVVLRSDHLSCSYFEQNRETLDPEKTILKTICPEGEWVDYRGGKMHVRGYLDRFLFTQGQMEMAVGKLSGGEQSRLLLAQLMLREANILVLDEPTNDLDMATLAVLEDCLGEFPGAVILVTHDRYFLDQVATRILAFNPFRLELGRLTAFEGLGQWELWHAEQLRESKAAQQGGAASKKKKLSNKLTYKDQREYDSIEQTIQQAEANLEILTAESSHSDHSTNAVRLAELAKQMSDTQAEIDRLYARWGELEKIANR